MSNEETAVRKLRHTGLNDLPKSTQLVIDGAREQAWAVWLQSGCALGILQSDKSIESWTTTKDLDGQTIS